MGSGQQEGGVYVFQAGGVAGVRGMLGKEQRMWE